MRERRVWSFAVNVRYKCGCVRMQRDFGEPSERTDDVKLCVETHDITIVHLISSIVYIKTTFTYHSWTTYRVQPIHVQAVWFWWNQILHSTVCCNFLRKWITYVFFLKNLKHFPPSATDVVFSFKSKLIWEEIETHSKQRPHTVRRRTMVMLFVCFQMWKYRSVSLLKCKDIDHSGCVVT